MREYRLLISHVAKDKDIALKCVEELEKLAVIGEGEDCFKIVPIYMENGCIGDFIEWSEKAVINSDGVLAVITENTAETSVADGVEANVKIVYNEISLARNKQKDILVLRKQGTGLQSGYELLLQNIKCTFFVGDDLNSAIADIVTDVILHAKRRFGGDPLLEYAGKVGARLIPSVIADTSEYLGRTDKLTEIDDYFKDGKHVVCITGFGGIGKTTLAKMYANAHPENPVVIQYCSAEEKSLKNVIISLGMEYDSPEFGKMTIDEKYALRIRQLNNLEQSTLIIIDNFNADFGLVYNREALTELSAIDKCKFIISSRSQLTRKDIGRVDVGRLGDNELMELFYRDSHCERNEQNDRYIKELIERTNGHTMTVELAAKAVGIDENGVSLPEIVDGLLTADAVTNVEDRHDGYEDYDTIYAHLRQLFNLSHIGDTEKNLLGALSFVARRGLTIAELKDNAEYDTKDLIRLCLLGYIVKSSDSVITYYLHPLIGELAFIDFGQEVERFAKIINYLVFKKSEKTGSDTLADLDMRLDYAEHIYGRLEKLFESSAYAKWNLAMSCERLGDILRAKGDMDEAIRYYLQCYNLADMINTTKVFSEGIDMIKAQTYLSISCNKLGDILYALGAVETAEQYYLQSYELSEHIYKETGTAGARIDLSVSCDRLGKIAKRNGDFDDAWRYYSQVYELTKENCEAIGAFESWRAFSISCAKLGSVAQAKEDYAAAEMYYEQFHEIAKAIYEERATIESRGDLLAACYELGRVLQIQGIVDEAEGYYRQAYKLAKENYEVAGTIQSRLDLSSSGERLGDIAEAKGDIEAAALYYAQSYKLTKAIYERTGTIESQCDLAASCNRLGKIAIKKRDIIGALQYYMEGHELLENLYGKGGMKELWRDLAMNCNALGDILKLNGDTDGASLYYKQGFALTKGKVEQVMTVEALDDLIVYNCKMSVVAGSYGFSLMYLYAALEIAEDLYNRHADINGRYKALVELLLDIYEKYGDTDGYEKMQKILKSLS